MKRLAGRIGVAQGSDILFSDFANGGVMWSGDGPREVRREVRFSETFAAAPAVMVGISMWDTDQKTNSRVDIRTEDITDAGFQIVFRTWGDTRIARIRVDWTAIGPLRDEEDWDVV
jgi:hypothetical protein